MMHFLQKYRIGLVKLKYSLLCLSINGMSWHRGRIHDCLDDMAFLSELVSVTIEDCPRDVTPLMTLTFLKHLAVKSWYDGGGGKEEDLLISPLSQCRSLELLHLPKFWPPPFFALSDGDYAEMIWAPLVQLIGVPAGLLVKVGENHVVRRDYKLGAWIVDDDDLHNWSITRPLSS